VLKEVSRRPIEPALSDDLMVDLRFDSLDILAIVAELEDRFGISIPMDAIPSRRTVADVIASVSALVETSRQG
jgi:acyl carrier protein